MWPAFMVRSVWQMPAAVSRTRISFGWGLVQLDVLDRERGARALDDGRLGRDHAWPPSYGGTGGRGQAGPVGGAEVRAVADPRRVADDPGDRVGSRPGARRSQMPPPRPGGAGRNEQVAGAVGGAGAGEAEQVVLQRAPRHAGRPIGAQPPSEMSCATAEPPARAAGAGHVGGRPERERDLDPGEVRRPGRRVPPGSRSASSNAPMMISSNSRLRGLAVAYELKWMPQNGWPARSRPSPRRRGRPRMATGLRQRPASSRRRSRRCAQGAVGRRRSLSSFPSGPMTQFSRVTSDQT